MALRNAAGVVGTIYTLQMFLTTKNPIPETTQVQKEKTIATGTKEAMEGQKDLTTVKKKQQRKRKTIRYSTFDNSDTESPLTPEDSVKLADVHGPAYQSSGTNIVLHYS